MVTNQCEGKEKWRNSTYVIFDDSLRPFEKLGARFLGFLFLACCDVRYVLESIIGNGCIYARLAETGEIDEQMNSWASTAWRLEAEFVCVDHFERLQGGHLKCEIVHQPKDGETEEVWRGR